MIYIQYAYQKTGLPAPTKIGLQIVDTAAVQADVHKEFSMAFPDAEVLDNVSAGRAFDVCIFAFRKWMGLAEFLKVTRQYLQKAKPGDVQEDLKLGVQFLRKARLGIGFFCISERTLQIIPRRQLFSWAIRSAASNTLIAIFRMAIKAQSRAWNRT